MPDIFLSYSRDDRVFMAILRDNLRRLGFNVWIDEEHLAVGTPQWERAIEEAVERVEALVVICTPSAKGSEWVNREVYMAKRLYEKPVFAVLALGDERTAMPTGLIGAHYADMRGRSDYDTGFRSLARSLGAALDYPIPDYGLQILGSTPTVVVDFYGHVEGYVVAVGPHITYVGQPETPPPYSPAPVVSAIEQLAAAVLALLPEPFEWCEIPAGQVTLGEDAGTFIINPFYMAKYPITYEQFQVFVDDPHGFKNTAWWQGLAADANHRKQPGEQAFTHAKNLPRENVSWWDAIAFCRWLSARTGHDIRLPAEWEWQWAAQGPDGREYPYEGPFDPAKGNTRESGIKMTSEVGLFPQGASPYGVLDMSGNVLEWCMNEHGVPENTGLRGNEDRAMRGGAWYGYQYSALCAYRSFTFPDLRHADIGFRLACFYLNK